MSKQLRIAAPVEPIVVGKMGSAYGIRGWLGVFSSTEETESIFDYQPWFIKRAGEWQPIGLESWKRHNQDLIIKVRDIEDREAATLLTNCEIVVDASQLPDLDSGEYYWKDLLGCQVITVGVYQLGEVIDLMKTGSNDVLVVKANLKDAFGIQERLIPFLDGQVIKNVDLATHVIEVDWDPGF
ncbi:MAG: ribosome maturation factor RimM [Sodalis sp. (in: enterobacteria)]|uniref:ribosome maturation factor RimM n=1 Tax=Sodalis sp. (in: enterobacteria) TaxID=1898979 RepID=UPI003F398458